MKINLKKIKELTQKYELFTIISNLYGEKKIGKNISRILYKNIDQIVTIKHIMKDKKFNFVKKTKETAISILEKGQLRLYDFELAI